MASSSFCETNFNCSSRLVQPDVCYDYVKHPNDINCFFPCLIDNCTKIINGDIYCYEYHCIGIVQPASFSNNKIWTAIGCSIFAAIVLALTSFAIFRKIKKRTLSNSTDAETDNLILQTEESEENSVAPTAPPASETETPN